jgi:hypothetical protein
MNKLIQLKTTPPLLITLALLCFGLLPKAEAVNPPPPGGYPNFTTAAGYNALQSLTSGAANTAIGNFALFDVTTGSFNTAVGAGALDLNTADHNTAVGEAALLLNTTGTLNTATGVAALGLNGTGSNNTANGFLALYNITGNGNIALGANAGLNLTTGDNNIDIGNRGVAAESSMIRIGDPAVHEGIFLGGITAMSPEAPNQAVIVDPATGQLGSADVTPEYAIVTVYVDRGGVGGPSRWAYYSAPLGSPAGTTVGGVFRFSCSAEQAPCKISYGAAVVSNQSTANAVIHPRLVIHKQDDPSAPMSFCENADGANNNAGLAQITRVPSLADAVVAMQTPLNMGIGGTLDCGSTQPYPPNGVATEIWVPAASNGTSTAFYDVWSTFGFGLTLELPPPGPGE